MKYLITDQAYELSNTEAIKRGCQPPTIYWWNVIEHPVTHALALELPDEEQIEGTIDTLPDDWSNHDQ